MSKSVIYASNSATQNVVASGTTINFGTINRKYGQNLIISGGNAIAEGQGYYGVDTNITFNYTGTDAGSLTAQIYQNGQAIPGAISTINVTANSTYAISIPTMIRNFCCNPSTITVVLTGAVGTVTNASILIVKE